MASWPLSPKWQAGKVYPIQSRKRHGKEIWWQDNGYKSYSADHLRKALEKLLIGMTKAT